MASFASDLITIRETAGTRSQAEPGSYFAAKCDICGNGQLGVVAVNQIRTTFWLRCVTCNHGYVYNHGTLSPSTLPLVIPEGLPELELSAWNEVRECLASGAYTAAVMMCRKILFHMAVANGLPEADEKGYAPSFASSVDHLQSAGIFTSRMRNWVDQIKDVGNVANHVIKPIEASMAMEVATFTLQLLKLTYEMDELMTQNLSDRDVQASE